MGAKLDFEMQQGARFAFSFIFEQQTGTGESTPVDLREVDGVFMTIKLNRRTEDVILDLHEQGYIWVEDAVNGVIKIDVPAEATEDIYYRTTAVYDIAIDFGRGNIIRPLHGLISFIPKVSEVIRQESQFRTSR